MSRRALQVVTGGLSIIPLATGVVGLSGLRDPVYVAFGVVPNALLDSNLRFFSGFWLGAGVTMVWVVRRIETEGPLFRALWGMIFVGGVGRMLSLMSVGFPPIPLGAGLGVLALELVGAPLMVVWQWRVARAAATR